MQSDCITVREIKEVNSIYLKPLEIVTIPNIPVVPKGTTSLIDTKPPVKAKSPIDIKLLVNTKDLMQMLSCGKPSAIKIGEDAHAKVCIGRKILWNVECVKKYINSIAE